MQLFLNKKILLLGLCINTFLHAELLIIKHEEGHFIPLDTSDKPHHAAITDILLKYQWPMVITNTTLTEEEKNELLLPNRPHAEEDFIRIKLQKIDPRYDVAFLPTALYELFIASYYKNKPENILHSIIQFLEPDYLSNKITKILSDPNEQENTEYSHIYEIYKKSNTIFYKNAFFIINNALATTILKYGPFESLQALNSTIKTKSGELAASYINKAKTTIQAIRKMIPVGHITLPFQKATKFIIERSIIQKVFDLEYEARELNKGILLRGSITLKDIPLGAQKGTLTGSMLPAYETMDNTKLYRGYKEKTLPPYSISFGNSLFAGSFDDEDATVYSFFRVGPALGYALLIDKKAYIHNHINELFFIAPLATLPAFFTAGEYFHSRTKVALADKKQPQTPIIKGIFSKPTEYPLDPAEVIVLQRDPFYHAELFSKFLSKNIRVVKVGDYQNFTVDEIDAYEKYLKTEQKKATEFYKAIPILERFATKASRSFRRKKLEKKQKEEQAQIKNLAPETIQINTQQP